MQPTTTLLLTILLLTCLLSACKVEDVRPYAAVETFPEDSILQGIKSRKAMIVIAHDDDMCAMTGTISAYGSII